MQIVAVVGWLVLFAAILTWQGIGLALGPPWPTMSSMIRAFMEPRAGRIVLFGVWLWLGWHLFIRGWSFFLRS